MINLFELSGIIGLVAIILGILSRDEKKEHLSFVVGGSFLIIYSYYLNSVIFLILQMFLVAVSVYELIKYDYKK